MKKKVRYVDDDFGVKYTLDEYDLLHTRYIQSHTDMDLHDAEMAFHSWHRFLCLTFEDVKDDLPENEYPAFLAEIANRDWKENEEYLRFVVDPFFRGSWENGTTHIPNSIAAFILRKLEAEEEITMESLMSMTSSDNVAGHEIVDEAVEEEAEVEEDEEELTLPKIPMNENANVVFVNNPDADKLKLAFCQALEREKDTEFADFNDKIFNIVEEFCAANGLEVSDNNVSETEDEDNDTQTWCIYNPTLPDNYSKKIICIVHTMPPDEDDKDSFLSVEFIMDDIDIPKVNKAKLALKRLGVIDPVFIKRENGTASYSVHDNLYFTADVVMRHTGPKNNKKTSAKVFLYMSNEASLHVDEEVEDDDPITASENIEAAAGNVNEQYDEYAEEYDEEYEYTDDENDIIDALLEVGGNRRRLSKKAKRWLIGGTIATAGLVGIGYFVYRKVSG